MARKGSNIRGGYKGGDGSGRHHGAAPKKPPLTHFLCIPLVTDATRPQLDASLSRFQALLAARNEAMVEQDPEQSSVPLKAVRPIGTIHFTLGVMSLSSIDRVSEAIGYLQTFDLGAFMQEVLLERALADGITAWPLSISLTSLHSMHPPKKTPILYAGPQDANDLLNPFCVKLANKFRGAGFLVPDERPLKLHATILNTIYAKSSGRGKAPQPVESRAESSSHQNVGTGAAHETNKSNREPVAFAPDTEDQIQDRSHGHGPNARAPIRLDATSLLDQCKDFAWASDFTLEKIAICKMGAKKILNDEGEVIDEQYEEIASIPLPSR